MSRTASDLTGRRFGRLVAIEPTDRRLNGEVAWRCLCDCGNEAYVARRNLLSGVTTSCGCKRREAARALCVSGATPRNLKNTPPPSNTSGVCGVHFWKPRGTWQAYINIRGTRYNLGVYRNFEDAVAARKRAEEAIRNEVLKDHEDE